MISQVPSTVRPPLPLASQGFTEDAEDDDVQEEGVAETVVETEVPENHALLRSMRRNRATANMTTIVADLARDHDKSETTITRYLRCIAENVLPASCFFLKSCSNMFEAYRTQCRQFISATNTCTMRRNIDCDCPSEMKQGRGR